MPKKKSRLPALLLCLGLLAGCGQAEGQPSAPEPAPSSSAPPSASTSPSSAPIPIESCQDVLGVMSYRGDIDQCAMTAEQALAYAQLLADGIAGKVTQPESHYSPAQADRVFWDTPYTVMGYSGEYQTDRANAVLGDFAGDGHPYLCVLSSTYPDCCFDVYYAGDGAADFVFGDETYGGRRYTTFNLDEKGKMIISTSGADSAFSHSLQWLGFANGETVVLHSLYEEVDNETQLVRVTKDGVEESYSLEEWQKSGNGTEDWGALTNAGCTPIPLRDMILLLNQYAAAKGSSQSVTVEERPEDSRIAAALLSALETCLNEQGGDQTGGDASLVDLDGDGTDELVVYNGSWACLYKWQDGTLQSQEIGWTMGSQTEWWLCRDTGTGEQGIEYQVSSFDGKGSSSTFYYPGRETSMNMSEEDGKTSYTVAGEEVTQEEYDAHREQNRRLEQLIQTEGSAQRVEQIRTQLKDRVCASKQEERS